ncbi:MAG: sodium/solute symporter, partial [Gemmatimonadota bacterium]|nr:sodium/solute symporter [Gemmatimonadota bacterium]
MILDAAIIVTYFVVIFAIGVRARLRGSVSVDEYFLGSRSLRWPQIAVSTIATNVHAGHFLGAAGSAYLYGLAQANLEINAIFGILLAAFLFVPMYLRLRVTTITQFFESRFGPRVALYYSVLMIALYGFMYLGSALFWASYAVNGAFGELIAFLGDDPQTRLRTLALLLGAFSATYTLLGGLRAVVRTDMVQFALLVTGGVVLLVTAVQHLGGWSQLYGKTGHLMHLHMPSDHPKLPWTAILGMLLLNLNYWGSNQIILQRALAARDLREAQIGLLVGGVLKYATALLVVVPGIALAGILAERPLADPDRAYLTLVTEFLPVGARGLVLCGLFASLMSTVDSIFNSVATLWSVDIYRRYLRPHATEAEVVRAGKGAILVALGTGLAFA